MNFDKLRTVPKEGIRSFFGLIFRSDIIFFGLKMVFSPFFRPSVPVLSKNRTVRHGPVYRKNRFGLIFFDHNYLNSNYFRLVQFH